MKLYNHYKKKKILVNFLQKEPQYLVNGKYKISISFNYCYLINKDISIKTNKLFYDKEFTNNNLTSNIKSIIKNIFFIFGKKEFTLHNAVKKFNGQAFMITHDRSSIKIFDFLNKLILTKYTTEKYFLEHFERRKIFEKHYKTPNVKQENKDMYEYIEDMVDYISIINYNDTIIDHIINDFINSTLSYYKSIKYKNIKSNINVESLFLDSKYYIDVLGDLYLKNILYVSQKEIYYIDYSKKVKQHFLFDFYTLIIGANDRYNFKEPMLSYLNGEYDFFLIEAFEIFNCKFESRDRLKYLELHLQSFKKKR